MENKDLMQLQHAYLDIDAKYMAQMSVIDNLRDENKHLRQVIEMLITSKSPTI